MFAYLAGDLVYKSPSLLHVDVHGVGYEVHITLNTYSAVQNMESCKLLIHFHIREDAWTLYGFFEEVERIAFRQLISVNGVGAATARIVLSGMSPLELAEVVARQDTAVLQKVKGIGAKTAQRILLELKDKLDTFPGSGEMALYAHNTPRQDALIALTNLGIQKSVAEQALARLDKELNLSVEDLIKQALKVI